jgi:hypothetical protein
VTSVFQHNPYIEVKCFDESPLTTLQQPFSPTFCSKNQRKNKLNPIKIGKETF